MRNVPSYRSGSEVRPRHEELIGGLACVSTHGGGGWFGSAHVNPHWSITTDLAQRIASASGVERRRVLEGSPSDP
jgi:hypothetical protein